MAASRKERRINAIEPLIGRVFQIMARAGQISPRPSPALDGLRLQLEYVSPMAAGTTRHSLCEAQVKHTDVIGP